MGVGGENLVARQHGPEWGGIDLERLRRIQRRKTHRLRAVSGVRTDQRGWSEVGAGRLSAGAKTSSRAGSVR